MKILPEKKENLLDALVNLLEKEWKIYALPRTELRRIAREILWVVEHNT
jgi:hypothetical protein